ncbi:MAG: phosphatase PAP2 family protein [Candidatus Eremiobacteraeota bacterium]|nr:phosphatase PAP2 family protein [Candidatus Eremiobacteraeota bacterium]
MSRAVKPEPAALGLVALALAVYWALYALSARLGDFAATRYHFYFEWERNIPLVPAAALVYLSITFMLIPLLQALPTARQLWPVAVTLIFQGLVASLCFWLVPLEDGFPSHPPVTGWDGRIWELSNQLALRHNYFPSLHVTLATSAALVLSRRRGRVDWPMVLWAAAIALSTLFVHQHHVADVLGGLVLALAGVHLVYDRLAK